MKPNRLLPLFLAALLQAAPLFRVALPATWSAASSSAFVLRVGAASSALLGAFDAVSGATTAIATPYTITATVGQAFSRRLTTQGHAAGSWGANPSPIAPGLSLSSSGTISGTPTQAGTFTATITAYEFFLSGPSTSASFKITVNPGATPPAITSPPATQTALVGANVSFAVTASGSSPLSYQWKFAGAKLKNATNAVLLLNNVQLTNSGTYTVTVTNAAGSVSSSATLTVSPPPAITLQPVSQIAPTGATATLTVAATGPHLTYEWRFNSNLLASATSTSLTLTNLTVAQSGFYSAVISTDVGALVSDNARLLVVPPPGPGAAPALTPLTVGGGKFALAFTTSPGYRYLIQRSGQLASTNWLTISNIPPAFTGGIYQIPDSSTSDPQCFYRAVVVGN